MVEQIEPFDSSMIISLEGKTTLTLSAEVAQRLLVQEKT